MKCLNDAISFLQSESPVSPFLPARDKMRKQVRTSLISKQKVGGEFHACRQEPQEVAKPFRFLSLFVLMISRCRVKAAGRFHLVNKQFVNKDPWRRASGAVGGQIDNEVCQVLV